MDDCALTPDRDGGTAVGSESVKGVADWEYSSATCAPHAALGSVYCRALAGGASVGVTDNKQRRDYSDVMDNHPTFSKPSHANARHSTPHPCTTPKDAQHESDSGIVRPHIQRLMPLCYPKTAAPMLSQDKPSAQC